LTQERGSSAPRELAFLGRPKAEKGMEPFGPGTRRKEKEGQKDVGGTPPLRKLRQAQRANEILN